MDGNRFSHPCVLSTTQSPGFSREVCFGEHASLSRANVYVASCCSLFQQFQEPPLNRNLCPSKVIVRTGLFEAEATEAVLYIGLKKSFVVHVRSIDG
jgi:hypothetical protein